jgi:xanthine dehydrogenase accessory factor
MDIYEEIVAALRTEDRVMLATIISTDGSTPASALSKMLVKQGGVVSVGTVGGGCMEGDVLLHANRLMQTGKAEILTFHLNEDDIEHGLICGGTLDVLIEPLSKNDSALFKKIKTIRDEGEDCILGTILKHNGAVERKFLVYRENCCSANKSTGVLEDWNIESLNHFFHHSITSPFHHSIPDVLQRTLHRNETMRLKVPDGELILEPITGSPRLMIFGGGHISKYVSRAAAMAGFRVTVVDDRDKYANKIRFPEAARTIAIDFTESFNHLTINHSSYIVIVTRGHQYDEVILEKALNTPAKYIGMIGSKRKVLTTYEHLLERGVTIEQLKRVHAPMGIEIGAVTAEEIAISIVAQLIRVRRGEEGPLLNKSETMSELLAKLSHRARE